MIHIKGVSPLEIGSLPQSICWINNPTEDVIIHVGDAISMIEDGVFNPFEDIANHIKNASDIGDEYVRFTCL